MTASGAYLALPRMERDQCEGLKEPGRYMVSVELPALWLAPGSYSTRVKVFTEGPEGSKRYFSETVNFRVVGDVRDDWAGVEILLPESQWAVERETGRDRTR
jgi:hypothetical protein